MIRYTDLSRSASKAVRADWRGNVGRLGGRLCHCCAERQTLSCTSDNATQQDCKNNDARRRGEGAGIARGPAHCPSGEATPQQRAFKDGCIDARGPAQRRDRGTRATQRPQAMPGMKRVHSPRRRANAAPDARPQQRNVQPSRRRADRDTRNTRVTHAGRPRQDDARRRLIAGVERV